MIFLAELSSQTGSTIDKLPLHKPITIFRYFYTPEFETFRKLTPEGLTPFNADAFLVARGDIVFGWKYQHQIAPIYDEHSSFILYNLETHQIFHNQDFHVLHAMGAFTPLPPHPPFHHRFAADQRTYPARLGI